MITNTGKNIIAKYLIGQAPAFASFMAFGCGAKPLAAVSSVVTFRQVASEQVTLTTLANHSFVPGSYIKVSGVTTNLDGIHKVKTVPSDTTLTYEVDNALDLAANSVAIAGSVTVDYSSKEALDFEMFRVPITSRGYITENGVSQVVLTAELPTEERYDISEIGIFSARRNPLAASNDSRTLIKFSEAENWEYHELDGTEDIVYIPGAVGDALPNVKALQINANNPMFESSIRKNRYETPRFLNRAYLVAGNAATLKKEVVVLSAVGNGSKVVYTTGVPHTLKVGDTVAISGFSPSELNFVSATISATPTQKIFEVAQPVTATSTTAGKSTTKNLVIQANSEHIHLNGFPIDLNKNAPTDEMILAFSVVSKDVTNTVAPTSVKLLIEFSNTDSSESGQHARFEVDLTNGSGSVENGSHNFTNNRYVVVKKQLKDLSKTSSFNWGDVAVVKVFSSVYNSSGNPTADYFVALDALRLENVSTISPVYGLTGYSAVANTAKQTITKELNTATLTEFRFGMDVQ